MRFRSPRSARLRLTLQYSGTFLLLGTVVVVITYLLAAGTATVSSKQVMAVPTPLKPLALFKANGHATVLENRAGRVIRDVVVSQRNADVRNLLVISWLVLAVTTVAAAGLGWVVAGRVLRPVRAMTTSARTISAGSLGRRLALSGPDDEFRQLGNAFNELLARLEAAFEAQRRFVANASHELRTPLTLERMLLQVALADPGATAGTLRATCEELLASGRDQERLLEALLTLANSERGLDRREPVDLARLTATVAAGFAEEARQRSVTVVTELAPAATGGDRALLERLIANLMDNAVRYNLPGGRVELRTGEAGRNAVLSVSNTGPLVAAEDRDALFEPFRRLGGARLADPEGHHGLGLSIVRAIATSHGGSVAADPRADGGLEVTVKFPSHPV